MSSYSHLSICTDKGSVTRRPDLDHISSEMEEKRRKIGRIARVLCGYKCTARIVEGAEAGGTNEL